MNKLCKEHLKGFKTDLKFVLPKYKLSKKAQEKLSAEIVDMVEQKMLIAYTQGLVKDEPVVDKAKNNEFKNWVLSEKAKGTPRELIQASVTGEARQAVIKLIWDWGQNAN